MHRESSATDLPQSVNPDSDSEQADTGAPELSARDVQLKQALGPILQSSVVDIFEKGSQRMVDSMYPLIGRAVRRSVRESLSALAQSVDATMRDTLTLKQLRWRLDARRQGISFSQLVLQKSLLFRVEEAFLIHSDTGLLISHVGARADDSRDLVSGMFTAIQDFVADSFGDPDSESDGTASDQLGRFQVGDHDVWLFHGPQAYIAVVIGGSIPGEYRENFHAVLEEIHERFGRELEAFDGDSEPLQNAGLLLEDCLIERQREPEKRSPFFFWVLASIVAVLLLGLLVYAWNGRRAHGEISEYLKAMPGVVVTEEDRGWRGSQFELLADPLAGDVQTRLAEDFPEAVVDLEIKPYRSLDPDVMVARVVQRFATLAPRPEPPVRLWVEGGVLKAEGAVAHPWLEEANRLMPILGVSAFDFSGLHDRDQEACEKLSEDLAALSVRFLPDQAKVAPNEAVKWRRLAEGIGALHEMAARRFSARGRVAAIDAN